MKGKLKKRNIKKDYQCKNLGNPFFCKKKKTVSKKIVTLIIAGIALIIGVLVWFFCAAPLWRLHDIRVEGLTRFSTGELEQKIWEQAGKRRYLVFRQDNLLLFNDDEAMANILAAYNFADLKIEKKLFHTLIVKVSERPYAFIFQQGNGFFYASPEAYVIREAQVSEEDKSRYLILENRDGSDLLGDGNQIKLPEGYLACLISLGNALGSRPELKVDRFIIDQEYNTIKVKFNEGPLVYFNTRLDPGEQIERLLLVKKEKIKDNFKQLDHIDLRYGDKIFYE